MRELSKQSLKGMGILSVMAALSSTVFSSVAFAQMLPTQEIRMGTPSYNGTGCPLGTVSASLSPDATSLSLLFGSFQVESGGNTGKTVERKACNISIPVQVPQGYTVSIIKIDYRGYSRIPLQASGTFDVEYFFAGQQGPAYRKSFVGAQDGNFTLNNELIGRSTVWSACGADVNLRTNASIAVQTNSRQDQSILALDSADYSSGVVYQLSWKQCGPGQGGGYPGNGGGNNPYPTPYPTPFPGGGNPGGGYPGGGYPGGGNQGLGPCVINQYQDARGFPVYMVKDGTGRVLGNTVQYAQALQLAEQSLQMGFCSYIVNNIPGAGQPYPPPPGGGIPGQGYPPIPQPGGMRVANCTIMTGRNAYGQIFYRVLDRAGRVVQQAATIQQAQFLAQRDARCYQ